MIVRGRFWSAVLAAALVLGACRATPPDGVAFLRSSISSRPSELQVAGASHSIQLGINHQGDLSIVEVRIEMPSEVEALWPVRTPGAPFGRICCTWYAAPRGPARWSDGEMRPGAFHVFAVFVALSELAVDDVLSFPVQLVLSDSSVVDWNGPPGSDRPAPTLAVNESLGSGARLFAIGLAAALAIVVLLVAGLQLVRGRRS